MATIFPTPSTPNLLVSAATIADRQSLVRLNPVLHKQQKDREEKKAEEKASRRLPFNPYAEALETARRFENGKKVVRLLHPEESSPLLGGHIDLKG
ncbi:MAG: hypothetical protein HY717_00785 [Planctomycetes bacterium]|nr:hypothetical protein [Planctomycetota bacterium]